MIGQRCILLALLGLSAAFLAGAQEPGKSPALRLLFSEVQAGSMASEQYCALVFADRHFHYEKASRNVGKDRERKVYEGELSHGDFDTLAGILESKEFRELNVPRDVGRVVVEDAHTITISVGRDAQFQNMEFLDNKSRKPYESQLKPLMKWWKSFRGSHMQESKAQPDSRCSLDSSHGVFSQ